MQNLLPDNRKKTVRARVALRVAAVVLGAVFFVEVATMIAFFPSYAALRSAASDLETRRGSAWQAGGTPAEIRDAVTHLSAMKDIASQALTPDVLPPTTLLALVAQAKPDGVAISAVSASGNPPEMISVTGFAATREDLSSFRKALRADTRVREVDIPVDSFLHDTDIDFAMTIHLGTKAPSTPSRKSQTGTVPSVKVPDAMLNHE